MLADVISAKEKKSKTNRKEKGRREIKLEFNNGIFNSPIVVGNCVDLVVSIQAIVLLNSSPTTSFFKICKCAFYGHLCPTMSFFAVLSLVYCCSL
jgi:hypothetical protein